MATGRREIFLQVAVLGACGGHRICYQDFVG